MSVNIGTRTCQAVQISFGLVRPYVKWEEPFSVRFLENSFVGTRFLFVTWYLVTRSDSSQFRSAQSSAERC